MFKQAVSLLHQNRYTKMYRSISSAFVIMMLSACAETNRDVQVLPSSTAVPLSTHTEAATPTIPASETPLSLPSPTPVPPSLILADFPLAVGTTWTYSAEISYQDPNDYMKVLTWTGSITDKVINKKIEPDGKTIFTVKEDLAPSPPQDVWRQSRTFEYTISGNGVFEGNTKVYQYPLEDNIKWKAFSGFDYDALVQRVGEVNTPFGKLNDCYAIVIATNPDVSMETFCTGIGFVEHAYRHFGTPQDEKFTLSSFTRGQP